MIRLALFSIVIFCGCFAQEQIPWTLNLNEFPKQEPARFIRALDDGHPQTIVLYGTSLTADGDWVTALEQTLSSRYANQATVINAAKGAVWSEWGLENLSERVLAHNPDAVFIEFSINDAYLDYKTSVQDAKSNLEQMISRIKLHNEATEIILMIMNPPTGIHLKARPSFRQYEDVYRQVAREQNLRLIDLRCRKVCVVDVLPNRKRHFNRGHVDRGCNVGFRGR